MKKMNKPAALKLRTETVRDLAKSQMAQAAGGLAPSENWVCGDISHTISCWGACSTAHWC